MACLIPIYEARNELMTTKHCMNHESSVKLTNYLVASLHELN